MATLTSSEIRAGSKTGSAWGWFIAVGVTCIALGAIAFFNLPTATTVSVYAIGILMLVGAAAQLAAAFAAASWSGFWLLLAGALLYGVAGGLVVANPSLGAKALTLALAFSLIFSGATRIAWSLMLRMLPGWGWMTGSGVISVLTGIVFIAGWPADTVYLLGMILAIDLTFQGATAIGLGIALRQATH